MRICLPMFVMTAVAASTLPAQHVHAPSPYAGAQSAEVPSLTPDELEQLRSGEGMGLARPAELNSYPGPRHVLELGESLGLTTDQREAVSAIQASMHQGAVALGERIISAEQDLNRRFHTGEATEASVREATLRVARLRGELRLTHLLAHLATAAVLSDDQIASYDRFRGYAARP